VSARDLQLVAALVAAGILALVFLKIGNEISEGETDRIDRAILLAFRTSPSDPIGSPAVEAAVIHISALGSSAVTTLIVIIATLFCAEDKQAGFDWRRPSTAAGSWPVPGRPDRQQA
jgi:hypothetical protein